VNYGDATPGTWQAGTWHLFLRQPASGGNATITWPSNFVWAEGTPPVLSTTPGFDDWIDITSYGIGGTFYATHVNTRRTVTTTGTQSLSNKTLTNPRINGQLLDVNGGAGLAIQAAANAVAAQDRTLYGSVASELADRRWVADAATVEFTERFRPDFERFNAVLATIVTASPLLGILGTVLGIIRSFELLGSGEAIGDISGVIIYIITTNKICSGK
jgi:hypothetical protein